MSEEREAKRAESEKRYADWVSNNPERVAEAERLAREGTDKFLEERRLMRETDLDAYVKLVSNEPMASRDPDLYFEKLKRHYIQDEMKKDLIAKRNADFEAQRAAKLAAREAERAAREAERAARQK